MLTPEQKARLTAEELVIAENWDKEKGEHDLIFDQIQLAIKNNDMANVFLYSQKLANNIPSNCEHGISITFHCKQCDDLDYKLYPENYINCSVCGALSNVNFIINGRCVDCSEE